MSSFIKFWVAIETLAMPNTSNIKPLNLALAKGYNLKITEAETRFQLGLGLNLRSKIVHDGLIVPNPWAAPSLHGSRLCRSVDDRDGSANSMSRRNRYFRPKMRVGQLSEGQIVQEYFVRDKPFLGDCR